MSPRAKPTPGPRPTILVVDDHAGARATLVDIVESLGTDHDVVSVGCQRDAFELLEARPVCCVLLDLDIPVRKGGGTDPATGEATRAHLVRVYPSTPVIIVTSHAEVETAVDNIKAGALDFAVKPSTPQRRRLLQQKVQDALIRFCQHDAPQRPRRGAAAPEAAEPAKPPSLCFDGTIVRQRVRLFLNGDPYMVQEVPFKVLGRLAEAALLDQKLTLETIWTGEDPKSNYTVVSRARDAFTEAKLPRDLIRNDGHSSYWLAVAPEDISVDPDTMKEDFRDLLGRLEAAGARPRPT